MKRSQDGQCREHMDFESADVQSTLDIAAVAKSLETAASQVKQLTKISGAQDVKVSVDALTKQVQTLQGSIAKHHTDTLTALNAASEAQRAQEAKHNSHVLSAIQAQTHHQFAQTIRKRINARTGEISTNDKRCLTFLAEGYGWLMGDKEKKPQHYGYQGHVQQPLESDDDQLERRWSDALQCLEIVTLASLTRGTASYAKFVKPI